MIELRIKLKRSFQPKNYSFGCSLTNDITKVTNWQIGNATILVSETGTWFCFAKRINSAKYSTTIITIDCGFGGGGGTGEACQIYNLHPYIVLALPTSETNCNIQVLPPTILQTGTTPVETGLENEIDEIFVPMPEFLNQIDFRFLGEFDIPLHPAPKFEDQRIIENVLKGRQFRHQNTVGDIFKKGFTGIDVILCRLGTERQTDPYSPTFQGVLNIKKTSVIDGGPSYPQLHLNNGKTVEQVLSINYADYVAITNDFKTNIPKKFSGTAPDKYNGRMVLFDIENEFNSIPTADFVNRTIGLYQAIKDGCGADVKIGFMYQGSPLQHTGFGVVYENYLQADPAWTQVSTATVNATAKGFPTALLGKSFATMDANMMAVVEYYLVYESFVPENSQLYARNGDKLKDYNGNILPLFTHFGKPQNNAGLANYKPSYLHPFAHTAGALGVNRKKLPLERLLILQTNTFNALTFHKDFGGTPEHAIIKQTFDGFAVYNIPNYIVAGIEAIAFFSGALYYLWEDATDVETPVNRNLGLYNPLEYVAGTRRLDYHGQGAVQAMAKRLAVKVAMINNVAYGFKDIIDGTEKYLLENIEVDYLTVAGFSSPKKINPLNWMEFKLTPVMAIVNEAKGLIAIWACPAFANSGETKTFDVYYRENGFNFKKRITATDYKNSLLIYKLSTSDTSTPITPPAVTQNIAPTTEGQSVILSASGCGFVTKWYKTGNATSVGTGSPITVIANNGNSYYAICENGTNKSSSSNIVAFSGLSTPTSVPTSVEITEPNKALYYFTNNHEPAYYNDRSRLPAIHKTGTKTFSNHGNYLLSGITMQAKYDMVNDLVWIKNSKVKFGINLLRGGQIAWASLIDSSLNMVYNKDDGGLQISIDAYQRRDGYSQNNKFSRKNYSAELQFNNVINNEDNPLTSYNTTLGGDFNNNSQSLISHGKIGTNGYFVKVRPIFYTFDCEVSQVEIEIRYTLEENASSLKCEYIYTSFRNDGQYDGGGFDAAAIPCIFGVNTLNRYQTYTGGNPFAGDTITDRWIPIQNAGGRTVGAQPEPIEDAHATERYGCVYESTTNKTLGVYIPSTNNSEYFKFKQLEVYAGNGTVAPADREFTGGFTYFDCNFDFASITNPLTASDRSNFTRSRTVYLIVETSPEFSRVEAYRRRNS